MYIEQPLDFEITGSDGKKLTYKLLKVVYGLK